MSFSDAETERYARHLVLREIGGQGQQRLKAARPGIAIGADLIAGFPTESEDMHGNSLRLIAECDIVLGHVFPYSPKAGTPAARMPQVAPAAIKAGISAGMTTSTKIRHGDAPSERAASSSDASEVGKTAQV